ncbi:rod shape-determining protein [bacterium]|nr:rod shape-determining protein [bacterium]
MRFFNGWFNKRIGIDLGTSNTLIYLENKGIVLCEPSIIAMDVNTNLPIAVGLEAFDMLGRTPKGIRVSRPLKAGVVAEIRETTFMLETFLKRVYAKEGSLRNPEIIIAVPEGITSVERVAIQQIAEHLKASRVYLPSEPLCAAIGAEQPVTDSIGSMIVDIGGGTTEVAVVSLSGIVVSESIRVAGNDFDDAIKSHLKAQYSLEIGENSAEALKIRLSSHEEPYDQGNFVVVGLNSSSGVPRTLTISREEILLAISQPLKQVIQAIKRTLEKCPPELAADIFERGIILTGGGALLDGLEHLIMSETQLPVVIANNPLSCVAIGAGKMFTDPQFQRVRELSLCA